MEIIARRLQKKEELIKKFERKESDGDALARSFKEESWRRNIDKLKREEMKELMVHFMFVIEQLSEHIEILLGRKPDYLKLISDTLKSLSAGRDKDEGER